MMKIMKMHWPAIVMILSWIIGFFLLSFSRIDPLDVTLTMVVILIIEIFLLSFWYGNQLNSPSKWLIIVLCGVIGLINQIFGQGSFDFSRLAFASVMTLVPSCIGMVLGHSMKKNKES